MNIKLYFSILCLISTFSIFSMSHEELETRYIQAQMQHEAACKRCYQIEYSAEGQRRIQEYQIEYGSYIGASEIKTLFPEESGAERAAHKEFMNAYNARFTPEASSNR